MSAEPVLRCALCKGIGRIRASLPGGHLTWRQCPACPPSETVTEALERAAGPREIKLGAKTYKMVGPTYRIIHWADGTVTEETIWPDEPRRSQQEGE